MSDNVQGSNQDYGTKASLKSADKSKPPPKKPPPQAPSQDSGGDISAPRLPPKPKREQARAIYDYKAQNDDELTIKKGDIIIILSKGVEDEGWWKGELNGKIGVFPDNYIEVIKSQPMDEVILSLRTKKPERLNEKPPPSSTGSPGGGIGSTNPTGSQSKLNSEVVRNNNNLKSTQQQQIVTTANTSTSSSITTNTTSNTSTSLTPTSAINPLTSLSKDEEENLSFLSPIVPTKKSKFRAPGSIPVTNLIKSSILGGSKPDVVTSHDTSTSANKLESSNKESKSVPDGRPDSLLSENENNFGSLEVTKRLNHPTANRVKGPNRRPPSMIVLTKEGDTEDDLEIFDEAKVESKQQAPLLNATTASVAASNDTTEKSPAVPPWMKELKRSQAERRFKTDTTAPVGEETHGANQATPLSPTKSNPSRSISLPMEINETNSSSTTTCPSSSPSTISSSLPSKPLKAVKPSGPVSSSPSSNSSSTPPPPKSSSIGNIGIKSADSSVSFSKGVSDFSDIQTELSNLKKSMVPRKDYEDLVKKVNELTDMVETVKESYGSVVRDLINQVAEARKNMATLEIEVDRLRKLSTTV
ncbi:SH3 domain-containing kinase-binding protein 1 isoform X1 [Tetranychus urticae]|uniref:SH3 domain-containing protein n=1 Tax=Tetranychus urticae TaxID=32264 RepID=T1L4C8_TETUR|nr:SH3 domain-containing kinase-binding protein 1 isoform X1 [Tetranychus urticae]